jgi:hypothetical protein
MATDGQRTKTLHQYRVGITAVSLIYLVLGIPYVLAMWDLEESAPGYYAVAAPLFDLPFAPLLSFVRLPEGNSLLLFSFFIVLPAQAVFWSFVAVFLFRYLCGEIPPRIKRSN